jgi:hypothetical protein
MPIAESKKLVRKADLKTRTKQFALRVMKMVDALPRTIQGRTIAKQIIRSSTSVELIIDSGLLTEDRIRPLLSEADELVAIMAASRKSAIGNRKSGMS